MSAYMMGSETMSVVAKYLADSLNAGSGCVIGIKKIQPWYDDIGQALYGRGCVTRDGEYDAEKIYNALMKENVWAIHERYGEEPKFHPFDKTVVVDEKEETRREWLTNLYTVCRCYHYQTGEGDVVKSSLYLAMEKWISQMAAILAEYVVKEIRPFDKPWCEF